MHDVLPFFRAWISDPLRVASIFPSSRTLAQLITSEIDAACGRVLELGPGTGVFTRALLRQGLRQSDLTLVETGAEFARMLERRFPDAQVLRMDAARLGPLDLEDSPFGAIVSGLPLLSMSPRKIMSILAGSFAHLREGGAFYQFTYSPRCPVSGRILDRLGLRATPIGRALFNMPPASVYRITRRAPLRVSAIS